MQTVTPAAEALGLAVRPEKGLREIDGGLWEGKHIGEIARAYPEDYARWTENIGLARCTGGESLEEVQARGLAAVLRIAQENDGKAVVLATYDRLTVAEVTALRGKFRAAECEYKVYKNTLVRKAFQEMGVTAFDADLNGATAFVFCPDETSGCSILAKAVKDAPALEAKIVPKSAYVNGAYVDKAGIKKLASIPSREVLIAKMLGCLQAPIANLAYVLGAIAKNKE